MGKIKDPSHHLTDPDTQSSNASGQPTSDNAPPPNKKRKLNDSSSVPVNNDGRSVDVDATIRENAKIVSERKVEEFEKTREKTVRDREVTQEQHLINAKLHHEKHMKMLAKEIEAAGQKMRHQGVTLGGEEVAPKLTPGRDKIEQQRSAKIPLPPHPGGN